MDSNKNALKAFVIGPIGDRDAPNGSDEKRSYEEAIKVWEEVIEPACEAFGIEPQRADHIARTGEIPDQIFRLLRDSEIVIADLTGANPNVMYELGLRHTTGKLTIQIGERGRLPFDVSAIRTILFKRTEAGLIDARRRLTQAIAVGLEDGGDPVTATRVWFQSMDILDVTEELEASAEDDEPGFLDKVAEAEEGMHAVVRTLENSAAITNEISSMMNEGTAEATRLDASGGGFSARLAIADRLAARLEDPASRLEVTAGEYATSIRRIDPGMRYLLQRLVDEPGQLREVPNFVDQIREMIEAAEGSIPSTAGFRSSLLGVGEVARSLRRVARRLSASLQLYIETSEKVVAWKQLLDRISPHDPESQEDA